MAAGTLVSSGSSGSMPTGSGSERLCRASIHELNNDTQTILSGTAGHIYTIISIVFNNRTSGGGNIAIRVNDGSNDISLYDAQNIPSYETFVWNDKFVIEENDDLIVHNQHTNADWYVSYIDKDFT